MKKTIAILFHEKHNECITRHYVISYLADIWREDGHRVIFLFGTKNYIPADICIVHIDLSVVPRKYLIFANRYPITLNCRIKDIRKRSFSKNIVKRFDDYQGMVIVKSNNNYAGGPERSLTNNLLSRVLTKINYKLKLAPQQFYSPKDYKIYGHPNDVPSIYYKHSNFVVEKFLPEKVGNSYFVHFYLFLGNCQQCLRLESKDPIVNGDTSISVETVKPHPDIIRLQKEMNFDYGKFDYSLSDRRAVLLDVNKTVGFGGVKYTEQIAAMHRQRAEALYAYFRVRKGNV